MVKRFHAGRAAQSGVYAALLAQRGFTGIPNIFESDYGGYCTALAPDFDRTLLTRGLGEVWETLNVGFKGYSACGSSHTTIDAILKIRSEHDFPLNDIESILIRSSSATHEHVGWPYEPESITTAQMNLAYSVAVTLLYGEAFVDQFTEDLIRDSDVLHLTKKVKVVADPEIDKKGQAYRHEVKVEIKLSNGQILKAKVTHAKGSDAYPLSYEEVKDKYHRLVSKVLSPNRGTKLWDDIMNLHLMNNLEEVLSDLRKV
jgi:aconitate decarboxylase